jgi:phage tail-like protein
MAAMGKFVPNPNRYDPYKGYRFHVVLAGKTVAAASSVSGLSHLTPAGTDAHRSAGHNKFDSITLERGVTNDTEFHKWASAISSTGTLQRRDLILELNDLDASSGHTVYQWILHNAHVTQLETQPSSDPSAPDLQSIERIVLHADSVTPKSKHS